MANLREDDLMGPCVEVSTSRSCQVLREGTFRTLEAVTRTAGTGGEPALAGEEFG